MKNILKDLTFVNVFIDAILIFSKSAEQHNKHILEVLETNGAVINFEKSAFFADQI